MTDYIVILLIFSACVVAVGRKDPPYEALLEGAAQGLGILKRLVPVLVLLLMGISILRASGAMDVISRILAPIFQIFGIPPETAILVLIRPISGSAALAVGAELMAEHGVNSQIGRTVAVMLGSTETTFYTISVYFGAAGIKKIRYTLIAALIADFTGFFMAALTVRLFMT